MPLILKSVRRWRHRAKKCLASLCTLSLLVSQQGFFVCEALAAANASRQNAAPTSGAAPVFGPAAPVPLTLTETGLGLAPETLLDVPVPQAVAAPPAEAPAAAAARVEAAVAPAALLPSAAPVVRGEDSAARAAARSAADAQDGEGSAAFSERLAETGAAVLEPFESAPEDGDPGRPAFDGAEDGRYSVLLTRHGREPVLVPLSSLSGLLAADPALLDSLNEEGKLRVVTTRGGPKGLLAPEDAERIAELLYARQGVSAQLQVETLPVEWAARPKRAVDVSASGWSAAGALARTASLAASAVLGWTLAAWIVGTGGAPLLFWAAAAGLTAAVYGALTPITRELRFLGRTLGASMTAPTKGEVLGGVGSKGPAFALNVFVWLAAVGTGQPLILAAALGLSLLLEAFHGVWLNSWNNFQDNLQKLRGSTYQVFFNWTYFQIPGVLFRALSWHGTQDPAERAKIVPPWDFWGYWIQQIGLMSVIGTVFGAFGTRGLNDLYNGGIINRWQRSAIDQVKSLMFLLVGMLFGPGSDKLLFGFIPMFVAFLAVFALQQTLDLTLYLVSVMAKKRTILYVVDEKVAKTKEFQAKYVEPAKPARHSIFIEILRALAGIPFILPFVLLGRWLLRRSGLLSDEERK